MHKSIEGHTTLEATSRGSASWNQLTSDIPTLGEERWRIVDEGDRWVVWFVPQNHPHLWSELADFSSEREAVDFTKSL